MNREMKMAQIQEEIDRYKALYKQLVQEVNEMYKELYDCVLDQYSNGLIAKEEMEEKLNRYQLKQKEFNQESG